MENQKTKERRAKPRKWKAKLVDVVKDLREKNGLEVDDCPGDFQKEIENRTDARTPEISYILRFLRVILTKNKTLPESFLLHRLIILFVLARIESLTFDDKKQYKFKKEWITDVGTDKKFYSGDDRNEKEKDEEWVFSNFDVYWNGGEIKENNNNKKIENHGEVIKKHFDEILGSVEKDLESRVKNFQSTEDFDNNQAPTLANFPEAFTNLVVIVGDYYGEINRFPEYHFELFRKSASNTVLTYLLQLGLPKDALILSDHLIMRAKETKRKELLADKNILVIGSPLVNIVSRFLTLRKSLIFNFVYRDKAYSGYSDFYDNLEIKLGNKPAVVRSFYKLMDKTKEDIKSIELKDVGEKIEHEDLNRIKEAIEELRELLGNDEAKNKDVIELFNPIEIFSPFSPTFLSSSTDSKTKDYALITIGENPWSVSSEESYPKRSLVAVCGLNRISTAGAMKTLLDKEELEKHPLGGLILVDEPPDSRGLKEIFESTPDWITSKYSLQDISKAIKNESQKSRENQKFFGLFNEMEFENYKRLVTKYIS